MIERMFLDAMNFISDCRMYLMPPVLVILLCAVVGTIQEAFTVDPGKGEDQ